VGHPLPAAPEEEEEEADPGKSMYMMAPLWLEEESVDRRWIIIAL
jgi:hypothetical protein